MIARRGTGAGRTRLLFPDLLRGITLLSMIGYHGMWDAVYLYGVRAPWYQDLRGYVWQQSICWTFLLLSGFSCRFSRNLFRRGAEVFLAGALVTAVTLLVLPEDRVVFGVLTCIGSCMLLTACVRKFFPGRGGLIGSAALFFLTRDVNAGYLGFERLLFVALPSSLYRNLFTAYLGFPPADFFSTDYFSLIPWLFLFLCGYFLNPLLLRGRDKKDGTPGTTDAPGNGADTVYGRPLPAFVRGLAFLGRHTLPVYLLHQPLLVLAFEFFL